MTHSQVAAVEIVRVQEAVGGVPCAMRNTKRKSEHDFV